MSTLMAIPKFERFFRVAAGIDVDKSDLRRFSDFVFNQIYEMLIMGQARANANDRDVLQSWDLSITRGLQERMHEFEKIDEEIDVAPILEHMAARPQLDVTLAVDTEARLPEVAGGLSVALGRSFKIIDTRLTNPSSEHWERAFRLFELLI
jgi:hypothetical protein